MGHKAKSAVLGLFAYLVGKSWLAYSLHYNNKGQCMWVAVGSCAHGP